MKLRGRLADAGRVALVGLMLAVVGVPVLLGGTFARDACSDGQGGITYSKWEFDVGAWFGAAPINCENETFTEHIMAQIPWVGESISRSMGGPHYNHLRNGDYDPGPPFTPGP